MSWSKGLKRYNGVEQDDEGAYVYYDEHIAALRRAKAAGDAEIARLKAELNTPEVVDFVKAVNLEAAHQRERWGSEHDSSKTDADWFWLVGYLVGKALHKPEKRLHHLITAGAALANWHLSTLGKTNMRPGIDARAAQIEEGE